MTPRSLVLSLRDEATADLEAAAEWYEGRRAGLGGEFLRTERFGVQVVTPGAFLRRIGVAP